MVKEKDVKILSRLRKDGRENLTKMSRETRIPVSTIYDRLNKYMGDVIEKRTVLLNYEALGYDVHAAMLVKVPPEALDECKRFLREHQHVNSVYRVNNDYDFFVEVVLEEIEDLKGFKDILGKKFGIIDVQEHMVLDDVKREEFFQDDVYYAS